jgi:gliding motility-associated-like protein
MRKLLYLTLILLFSNINLAKTIFVNSSATGSNNGTSWINAYTDLQNAINNATDGDEIWVAKGTYFPTRPADNLNIIDLNNRDNSFVLKNNVKMFGGFSGSETLLNQRDWNSNPTILSGDIGIPNDDADNCYHVVITLHRGNLDNYHIDGFTVSFGNGNGNYGNGNNNDFLLIGSQYIYRGSGGGLLLQGSKNEITNLNIINNKTYSSGGGISNSGTTKVFNSKIEQNNVQYAYGQGGGIMNSGVGELTIENSSIKDNYASQGGGLLAYKVSLKNCAVISNTSISGGGIFLFDLVDISGCVISGNKSEVGGGIFSNGNSSIKNSLISGNEASKKGGGLYGVMFASIINCTIVSNKAEIEGGAGYIYDSRIELYNSIIYGNNTGWISEIPNSFYFTNFYNCNIQNSTNFTNSNISVNPLFISQLPPGLNTGGNYQLKCGSPCIDSGNNTFLPQNLSSDLINNNRITNITVDMGPYEFLYGIMDPIPTPAPITYCLNQVASPLSISGNNLLWYSSDIGGNGNTNPPTPNTSSTGTFFYFVSQSSTNCTESPRTAVQVNVVAENPPIVTSNTYYCQNQMASALSATGTNLLWYTSASGGTGSTTAPTPNTSTAGTTTYYVTQNTNGCESARAAITVTVGSAPATPIVTPKISYCQNETATALSATGTNLFWYTSASGGTGTTTAPKPDTSSVGITTYYVTQTVGCESQRSAIEVTVNPLPQSPIVTPSITYCQNETTSPLNAIGTNLLWYTSATGGIGNATAPTPNTSSAGITTYYVTQTVSGCESPRVSVNVEVKRPSILPTVIPTINYCQNQSATALSANGSNLLWYTSATGGIGSTIAPTPNTANAGTTTYYVTQNTNGCESDRAAIAVTVGSAPAAPIVTPKITYCQNETATTLSATGTNLLWYNTTTGGTGNTTPPTPDTSKVGITTYYVTQTVGCESQRSAIEVTVLALPTTTLPGGSICKDKNNSLTPFTLTTNLNPSRYSFQWYSIQSGNAIIIPNTNQNNYPVTVPGEYGVIIKDNSSVMGCESEIIKATVTLENGPTSITISQSQYFTDNTTIKVDVLPAGNYQFQLDNSSFQSSNTFTNVKPGKHEITVGNPCGTITEEVLLVDYPSFFTPNGDGFNETWNIDALQDQPESSIEIYDRFSKLITIIKPNGLGWDGTYQGKRLPSDDYWFVVHYADANKTKKTFKAHFSLKR